MTQDLNQFVWGMCAKSTASEMQQIANTFQERFSFEHKDKRNIEVMGPKELNIYIRNFLLKMKNVMEIHTLTPI